jgi:hypothetical protein
VARERDRPRELSPSRCAVRHSSTAAEADLGPVRRASKSCNRAVDLTAAGDAFQRLFPVGTFRALSARGK